MFVREPSVTERFWSSVFHLYPFLSGCGSLSNSRLSQLLVPRSPDIVWARLGMYKCAVPLDDLVGRAIFLVGDLDRKVTVNFLPFLRKGDIVLDVGANLGLVSFLAAAAVGETGKVVSFEPSPSVNKLLDLSISSNPESPIKLMGIGLGSKPGRFKIMVPQGNAGRASLVEVPQGEFESHSVQVRDLDSVLKELKINHVDFMKLDVEGFETEVFTGLFKDSTSVKPSRILFEDHKMKTSRNKEILLRNGYKLHGIRKGVFLFNKLIPMEAREFEDCSDFVATISEA